MKSQHETVFNCFVQSASCMLKSLRNQKDKKRFIKQLNDQIHSSEEKQDEVTKLQNGVDKTLDKIRKKVTKTTH